MNKTIPFFSLKRQWHNLKNNMTPKLNDLLESNMYIGGSYVSDFEKNFASYIGSSNAIACNSGTDALWLALKALKTSNSIVLTTPFSFIASSSEIVAHNAHPLFLDIDESYNICPSKIENWLKLNAEIRDNRTFHKTTGLPVSGIITVDIFGQCANYKEIDRISKEWNLWVVEDACQAVGGHIDNKKAGTFGDIACFSLYPTKNLGAYGDGGIMTTNNKKLAEEINKLRNHGRASHYNYECYGINSRLDAIQAMIVNEKLKTLDATNNRRREIAAIYNQELSGLEKINTPREIRGHHVYHQYCITTPDRDKLREHLTNKNIGTNIFYPKLLSEMPFLQTHEALHTETPIAKKLTQEVLALPIWPELTNDEVGYVCECVKGYF